MPVGWSANSKVTMSAKGYSTVWLPAFRTSLSAVKVTVGFSERAKVVAAPALSVTFTKSAAVAETVPADSSSVTANVRNKFLNLMLLILFIKFKLSCKVIRIQSTAQYLFVMILFRVGIPVCTHHGHLLRLSAWLLMLSESY